MSELTKNQLKTDNNSSFPNNTTGYITPTILRDFNVNMIDSLVDEVSYNVESASFSSSIAQLQSFSSSLDATYATDAQLTSLSSSVATTDAGQDSKISSLINATGSYITAAQTASMTVLSSSYAVSASFIIGGGGSVPSGTVSSSAQIAAFGYATTGSNVFKDSQVVSGSVTVTSNVLVAAGTYTNVIATADVTTDPSTVFTAVGVKSNDGTDKNISLALNSYAAEYPGVIVPSIIGYYTSSEGGTDIAIGFPSNGQADHWKKTNLKYGLGVTGSTNLSGSFRAVIPQPASIGTTTNLFASTASIGTQTSLNLVRQSGGPNTDLNQFQLQVLSGSSSTGDTLQSTITAGIVNNTSSFMTGSTVNNSMNATWATGSGGGRVAYNATLALTAASGSATATITANSIKLGSSTANVIHATGSLRVTGSVAITGSNPTIVNGTLSGSLISNLGDIYTGSNNANFIVTLGSASMASLLAGSTTDANTLYFVLS